MTSNLLQRKRVNSVMDYITNSPGRSFALDELASIANYSEYHFHRLFRSVARQTPGQFVFNQRLHRAARTLAYNPKQQITEVAAAYGFSSNANFSKAFRPVFGMSPREFRGNADNLSSRYDPVPPKSQTKLSREQVIEKCWEYARSQSLENNISADKYGVSLRNSPEYRVAYMRKIGPYLPKHLDYISDQLVSWISTTDTNPLILGVTSTHPTITPSQHCLYDICAVLPDGFDPGKTINVQTIKGGLTAVLQCKLGVDDFYYYFQAISGWMTLHWLPSSGYQPDDRPTYEIYLESPRTNHSDYYLVEICIPVRPLNQSVCMI